MQSIVALMHRNEAPLAWDDVRLFLTLYRARTVGEAARVLGVDPSTVSRRLVGLERALATTLFERGRDGVKATEAAEDLLPTAELVEHGVQQFAHAADGLEREVAGLVRITCPPDVAEVFLMPVLQEMLRAHPELLVEIEPSESVRDLTRREADLAMRVVRPQRGDLVFKKVFEVQWVVAAAPSLVERLGQLQTWSEVPWVACGEQFDQIPAARWRAARAGDVPPRLRSDSLATQVHAAVAGLGVGLFPAPTARHHGLVPLNATPALAEELKTAPSQDLYLVTHRALRTVPRVRVVWDGLAAAFADYR